MNLGLPTRTRERLHNAADHARDVLDTGMAMSSERARTYADLGLAQLERARAHLPVAFQRPSTPMVLSALGAGLLIGLFLGGKASHAVEDISEGVKDATRRRRLRTH